MSASGVPPPPPPPPAVGVGIRRKEETFSFVNPPLSPEERSVIEYPEPQTVASLRSAIQSKLNGSAPVKVEPPEIYSPQSSTIPVTVPIPPAPPIPVAAPPPPPPTPPQVPSAPAVAAPPLPPVHINTASDPPPPQLKVFSSTDRVRVGGQSQTLPRRRDPSPPPPTHYSRYTLDSPLSPPRPPLPLMSPLPPAVPPAPHRPENFVKSYEESSYRGWSCFFHQNDLE